MIARNSLLEPPALLDAAPITTDNFLQSLLQEQSQFTAVERFSQLHEQATAPLQARYYRDLLPLTPLAPDERFAFEVDLDACSGCKACVVACHNLNGLEEEETWREVGMLVAEPNSLLPVLQHVTTACHHCVEPGCLAGCPVQAYEKDPVTGIVHHLDDQCFGCQYCIWMCPYEVPKFSAPKGIVRKCDMCRQRLDVSEAPACVQSCPNRAIRIAKVKRADALAYAKQGEFLSGTPDPAITKPSTRYVSQRTTRLATQPADWHVDHAQHAHVPLVVMLILTQGSVGCLLLERCLASCWGIQPLSQSLIWSALALALVGLPAATLHLGRLHLAWRAFLGLRTSWLSREMLAFGIYITLLQWSAMAMWWEASPGMQHLLNSLALGSGIAGLYTSAMIYIATQRDCWSAARVSKRFLFTTLLMGLTTALVLHNLQTLFFDYDSDVLPAFVAGGLLFLTAALTLIRWFQFLQLCFAVRAPTGSLDARIAKLLHGSERNWRNATILFGTLSGMLFPLLTLLFWAWDPPLEHVATKILGIALTVAVFAARLGAEFVERYLFFTTAVWRKMPGGLGT